MREGVREGCEGGVSLGVGNNVHSAHTTND